MPSMSDVVVYLLLLPLMLLGLIFLVWKQGSQSAPPGIPTTISGAQVNTATGQNQQPAQTALANTLTIIASSIITRYGSTADDLVAGLASARTTFELDPQLIDENGYPILSGRIAELDAADAFIQYKRWGAMHETVWSSADERALALAYRVCTQLIDILPSHLTQSGVTSDGEGAPQTDAVPLLCLIPVLPERWPLSQKNSVTQWLVDIIAHCGWPVEKIMVPPLEEMEKTDPLAALNRLNVEENPLRETGLYLLIASESFIGADNIASAQAQHQLHSKQRMKIPGEAAAGMAFTVSAQRRSAMDSTAQMHQVIRHQRDKVAQDQGRIKPSMLTRTIRDALESASINPEQLTTVIADTDARVNRIGELYEAMQEIAPEIETADCLRVAGACGAIGAVAGLAALLIAKQVAEEKKQPVLCVSNNDEAALFAVGITP